MSSSTKELWLENQICFPLYAVSRLVTKQYAPILEELDITYPQYLVLLVLWKKDNQLVSDINKQLLLESNTLTPLLKRMEQKGLVVRDRLKEDERKVRISLTPKAVALQDQAACIPQKILDQVGSEQISKKEVEQMLQTVHKIIERLT